MARKADQESSRVSARLEGESSIKCTSTKAGSRDKVQNKQRNKDREPDTEQVERAYASSSPFLVLEGTRCDEAVVSVTNKHEKIEQVTYRVQEQCEEQHHPAR